MQDETFQTLEAFAALSDERLPGKLKAPTEEVLLIARACVGAFNEADLPRSNVYLNGKGGLHFKWMLGGVEATVGVLDFSDKIEVELEVAEAAESYARNLFVHVIDAANAIFGDFEWMDGDSPEAIASFLTPFLHGRTPAEKDKRLGIAHHSTNWHLRHDNGSVTEIQIIARSEMPFYETDSAGHMWEFKIHGLTGSLHSPLFFPNSGSAFCYLSAAAALEAGERWLQEWLSVLRARGDLK